jgi:hypothetical protein
MEKTVSSSSVPTMEAEEAKGRIIYVSALQAASALSALRVMYANERKRAVAKKYKDEAAEKLVSIHEIDARLALLAIAPKNRPVAIDIDEAIEWGFGLMPNGRWPKL